MSMATLNRAAAEAMKEAGASACTDVTGFGLFAHLRRMLRAEQARRGDFRRRPARVCRRAGGAPAGHDSGRGGAEPRVCRPGASTLRPGVDEALVHLGFDAQTSGGLLVAVPVERLETLRQSLARRGAGAFVIGRVTGETAGEIRVRPGAGKISKSDSTKKPSMKNPKTKVAAHGEVCCADIFKNETGPASTAESQRAFGALLRSVQAGGALSEKARELILFGLVVQSRCRPCFEAHFRRARELGITQAELDEAAWCAIAMSGAPVKMFYQENLEKMAKAGG